MNHEEVVKLYSDQLVRNSRKKAKNKGNNSGDDGGSIVDKKKRRAAIVVNKNKPNRKTSAPKHFAEYKCSAADFNPRKSRASVSKSIPFFKRLPLTQTNTNFEGQLKIRNKSNLVISYSVQASIPSKFHMTPNPYWICPHSEAFVEIRTRKNRANSNAEDNNELRFEDIVSEFFVVFVTPIFRENHLEPKNLDIIWRALGTDSFPYYQAEEHIVEIKIAFPEVFPKCSTHYVTDFSILDLISLLASQKSEKVVKKCKKGPEVEEFKSLWSNASVNDSNNELLPGAEIALECRTREIRRSFRRCELKVTYAQKVKTEIVKFTVIMLGLSIMLWWFL